jgi:hypothetical protein
MTCDDVLTLFRRCSGFGNSVQNSVELSWYRHNNLRLFFTLFYAVLTLFCVPLSIGDANPEQRGRNGVNTEGER